jgi:hypothetical protein
MNALLIDCSTYHQIWDFNNTSPSGKQRRKPRPVDRQSLIARYSLLPNLKRYKTNQLVQMRDVRGNTFTITKRVVSIDPSQPTYIRIPTAPISRSWVKHIRKPIVVEESETRYLEVESLDKIEVGNEVQVVYMSPPIAPIGKSVEEGFISWSDFVCVILANG